MTGSATSVTTTTATLNGTVDPNGRATTWYFEYGTSTSYGSKTAEKSAGSGTSTTGVAAPVSGLTRGRLYHYRLVATSDAGTSRGADQTFSTITAPAAVTGAASSIGLTSAKLNGTVTPNGQATSWYFEYGTSTSYGTKTSAKSAGSGTGAVKVAASLTGLRRTTTYHYRLVATNASGTTVGGDRTFSTSLAPSVRTGAAQNVAATTATLTGAVDRRGRATNWYFEYGTSTSYGARTPNQGRPLRRRRAKRDRTAHEAHAGDDLPLPARRDERRRDGSRSGRDVRDGRCHSFDARAPGRLRTRPHAVGIRPGQAGGRDRDDLRPTLRRRVVQVDRDRF